MSTLASPVSPFLVLRSEFGGMLIRLSLDWVDRGAVQRVQHLRRLQGLRGAAGEEEAVKP